MATGDQADIANRITILFPKGWFGDTNPVLNALIQGTAWCLSQIYSLIAYAQLQTRIKTATDGFLDLISFDFFGGALPRNPQELDSAFRARILAALLQQKVTRQGMIDALVTMTGKKPIIFEPARPLDAGPYGKNIWGYGVAGGYGSLALRAQAFITAYMPDGAGIPYVAGYGSPSSGYSTPSYGEWASLSLVQGAVTEADIYQVIDATKAAGTEMWVSIRD